MAIPESERWWMESDPKSAAEYEVLSDQILNLESRHLELFKKVRQRTASLEEGEELRAVINERNSRVEARNAILARNPFRMVVRQERKD